MIATSENTLKKLLSLMVFGFVTISCQAGLDTSGGQTSPKPEKYVEINDSVHRGSYQSDAYYYYSAAQQALKTGQIEEAIWLIEKAVTLDPDSLFLKVELADIFNANRQFDKALSLVEKVLNQQPDNIAGLLLAGKIHQNLQDTPKALAFYEKVLEADPSNQNAYILLGRIYWDTNDFTSAVRLFKQMTRYFPGVYSAHYFLGKALLSQGDYDAAADAFHKALELEPSLEEPRMELINIYKVLGKTESLPELYRQILAHHPENFKIAFEFVAYLHKNNQSDEADLLLAELGRQSRRHAEIIVLVFNNYIESKQFVTAVRVLEGMLEGEPESSDLHYLAGVAYDGLEQPPAALSHLIKVNADSRFYPNAIVHSALLYHNSKQTDLAVSTLENAIQKTPEHTDFYYYLSSFHEDAGRLQDAVEVLEKGVGVNPKEVRIIFKLGVVLDKSGNRQACIEKMREVIQLAPDHTDALNYLGYTYAEMGINLDEAEAYIRTALEKKPDNGYITDSLGWVFFKQGKYKEALATLLKALELVPDDPAILEHIGDVYNKLNDIPNSRLFYLRALELNPENPEAIKQKLQNISRSEDTPPEKKSP